MKAHNFCGAHKHPLRNLIERIERYGMRTSFLKSLRNLIERIERKYLERTMRSCISVNLIERIESYLELFVRNYIARIS